MRIIKFFQILAILVVSCHSLFSQSHVASDQENADPSPLTMLSSHARGEARRKLHRDGVTGSAPERQNSEMEKPWNAEDQLDREDNKIALNRLTPRQDSLTLEHLRAVLEAHPEVERLISVPYQHDICPISGNVTQAFAPKTITTSFSLLDEADEEALFAFWTGYGIIIAQLLNPNDDTRSEFQFAALAIEKYLLCLRNCVQNH